MSTDLYEIKREANCHDEGFVTLTNSKRQGFVKSCKGEWEIKTGDLIPG
jgi:hypothetical protein